jgi:hypothetical protein
MKEITISLPEKIVKILEEHFNYKEKVSFDFVCGSMLIKQALLEFRKRENKRQGKVLLNADIPFEVYDQMKTYLEMVNRAKPSETEEEMTIEDLIEIALRKYLSEFTERMKEA